MKLFNQLIEQFDSLTDYRFDRSDLGGVIDICAEDWPELGHEIVIAHSLRNDDLHYCALCQSWFNDCGYVVECKDKPDTHGTCIGCRENLMRDIRNSAN